MVVAGLFGSNRPSLRTLTSALGSSGPAEKIPRGRWYLKDLARIILPLAIIADARVSPRKP